MSDHFLRLGQRFRETRQERKLDQKYVANAAGISLRTLQRAELEGVMSAETAKAVGAVLSIDTDQPLPTPMGFDLPEVSPPRRLFEILKTTLQEGKGIYVRILIYSWLFVLLVSTIRSATVVGPQTSVLFSFWVICYMGIFLGILLSTPIYLNTLYDTLVWQDRVTRLSITAPMLQTTLHTLQSALQDPSLSFQQLSEHVQEQVYAVHTYLKDHPDTFAITPLLYLQEDMRRGISPRKTLVEYLRAQHGILRAGFDPDPRLQEDLADELQRLKQRVSVFAG